MPAGRYMTKDEMASAVSALDQSLYVHEQWCSHVYACLICHLPPDDRDLSDNPHQRCPFGQWYYAQEGTNLSNHPAFVAIAPEHAQLHEIGARMLLTSQAGEAVPVRDYEGFVNAVTRMRVEIAGLRHELDDGLTNIDPLTGATSRVGMLAKLRIQLQMVKRDLHPCTIAMMDLDLFKNINDRHGHQAGDRVLVEVVRHLMDNLRAYDEFYRYGGDEFLICIPGTDLNAATEAVERLRKDIAALAIDVDGQPLGVTASFGLAQLDPDVVVEESIARADDALYRAKSAGRDQTQVWAAP
jgi:diguanylate cyclase